MLRFAPAIALAAFLLPVAAGLAGTLLPALGYLPALGGDGLSLQPWRDLAAWPGLGTSVRLTISTGLLATAVSLVLALGLAAAAQGTRLLARLQAALPFLLAPPHAAMAIGLAFLIAPSGWLARMVSPGLSGWVHPPDLLSVQDPHGLALVGGLVLKEVPFLLLMLLAALNQIDATRQLAVARSLGYGKLAAWLKVILPQTYPQIRLPVYAVLAFSLSVVDVAIILGPNTPPPLGPQILVWYSDPDLARNFIAAAGAVLQLGIVVAAIAVWRAAEILLARSVAAWHAGGSRGIAADHGLPLLRLAGLGVIGGSLLALVVLLLWSLAGSWPWPAALPVQWSLRSWTLQAPALAGPLLHTLVIAGAAVIVALLLGVACLEHEARAGIRPGGRALWLLYLPLLVPQTAFLFGLQVVLVRLGLDGTLAAVVWSHLVFVLPYMFLTLADPWRHFDARFERTGASLGASPLRIFLAVKLPMLLRPLLFAAAIGVAVSVSQYLPTLFAGAGRIATLTTEAVTLAGGSDRRLLAAFAFSQALLPLLAFAAALALPAWLFRRRAGMGMPA